MKSKRISVPYFEIYDCPTINLKELREKGLDCVIRNEVMVDGKLRVFSPPKTARQVLGSLAEILHRVEVQKDFEMLKSGDGLIQ